MDNKVHHDVHEQPSFDDANPAVTDAAVVPRRGTPPLRLGPTLLASFCCAFAALGSFLFGYDTGVISSTISQLDFIRQFGNGSADLPEDAEGAIVSAFMAGAIVGSLGVSLLSDRFGRRGAIWSGAVLACVGGALQGGANVLATMITGRLLTGVGVGFLSATIPNYCSEVAPARIRGLLAGMQQWMIGLGIVTAQWVGYGGSLVGGSFSWRFPLAIQVAPALILAAGIYCLPESPRYLAEHGDEAAARRVLVRLHADGHAEGRDWVETEMDQIRQLVQAETESRSSITWAALITRPALRKRLFLACGIQLFGQLSGTNVIGYYSPKLYIALRYSVHKSLFITGLYGAFAQLFNTIFMAFLDQVGRRRLLIPSLLGMGAALCVEATLAKSFDPDTSTNSHALRAMVAMNFVFALFFTSLGLISWIYPSEIFPTALRARGTAVATFTNWAVNLVIGQLSPKGLNRLGFRYFYIFMAFNWTAAGLVYFFYPETGHGQTLEEVSHLFGDFDGRGSHDEIEGEKVTRQSFVT